MAKLSKASKDKLDELCSAAMSWGWQQDQGVGSGVDRAEKQYKAAVKDLSERILYLEEQLRKEKLVNRLTTTKLEDTERRLRRAKRATASQGYTIP